MLDLHSHDQNGNVSAACKGIPLKFGSLLSLENYRVSVYHAHYPMNLYF